MSGVALVLAGHGSHISADTAGIVWSYADRLRRMGVADEVTACFWKEPPAFAQILDTLESSEVVIVPLFTARGYFTSQVIPVELGMTGESARIGSKRVHLTAPIGEHPLLDDIVDRRLQAVVDRHNLPPAQTAAAIIGHGTPRNRQSRDATRRQAERSAAANTFREVVDCYLDDQPDIPSVYRRTRARHIVALPYFLAPGSHVTQDVPRALGIRGNGTAEPARGRLVYYAEPVGTDESICEVILALARTSGLPFESRAGTGVWDGFPTSGHDELLAELDKGATLRFGQVRVSGRRVWHEDSPPTQAVNSPANLRKVVRDAPFRPLPSRKDLPGGWHVPLDDPADAQAALETVYPGLVADWAAQRRGELRTESLEDIGSRQDGMFKDIHKLPAQVINHTLDTICGDCVRVPTWHGAVGDLPCRGPCNWWLTAARKHEKEIA